MTVAASQENRFSYAGNGVTTAFAYSAKFLANADLVVVLVNDTTGVETVKTLTTHYTITGAGAANGGTVTMLTAPATGETLVIYGDPTISQAVDPTNGGFLDVDAVIEAPLDKLTIVARRLKDLSSRSLRFSDGADLTTFTPTLGTPPAGYMPRVNVAGTGLEWIAASPADDTFTQSGTGAVARSWTSKVGDVVAPEDFGCTGNGTSDDGAAFLLALQAVQGSDKILRLTSGKTYLLTTWTTPSQTGTIRIDGRGATVKGPASVTDFLNVKADTYIYGGAWERWDEVFNFASATGTINRFECVGAYGKTLTTGFITSQSNVIATLSSALVANNRIDGGKYGVYLALNNMGDIQVLNNILNGVTYRGIHLGWNDYTASLNWNRYTIHGNIIKDVVTADNVGINGIIVYGNYASIQGNIITNLQNGNDLDSEGIYTKCRHAVISGNILLDAGRGEGSINIKGSASGAVDSPNGFNVICANNSIRATTAYAAGKLLVGIAIRNHSVLVNGNDIYGINTDGIYCAANTVGLVTISNNHITEQSGTAGIRIAASGSPFRIIGNTVRGTMGSGITVQGQTAATEVEILNNCVNGTATDCITIRPTTAGLITVVVRGNLLKNTSGEGVQCTTAGCASLTVEGNKFNIGSTVDYLEGAGVTHLRLKIKNNEHTIRQTTDGTLTTVLSFRMPDNCAARVRQMAVAVQTDGGNRALYEEIDLYYRDGGSCTQEGSTVAVAAIESAAGWGGISRTVSSDQLTFRIDGDTATTINWRFECDVEMV